MRTETSRSAPKSIETKFLLWDFEQNAWGSKSVFIVDSFRHGRDHKDEEEKEIHTQRERERERMQIKKPPSILHAQTPNLKRNLL